MILLILYILMIIRLFILYLVDNHQELSLKVIVIQLLKSIFAPVLLILDFIISTYQLYKHFGKDLFQFFNKKDPSVTLITKISKYVNDSEDSLIKGFYLVLIMLYTKKKQKKAQSKYYNLFESFKN